MEGTTLRWFKRGEKEPPENKRILVFSPEYSINDKLRLIDSQFWATAEDASHWVEPIEPGLLGD
jgi:hypothetical protein